MTDKPRFILELSLTNTADLIKVDDPTIIDDKLIQICWNMIGYFIESTLDELGLEANETRLRELIIECCYRLILREMTTLRNLPLHEYGLTKSKPKSRRARRKARQEGESDA